MDKDEALKALGEVDRRSITTIELDELTYAATDGESEVWADPEYDGIYHWRIGEQDTDLWDTREFESERKALLDMAAHLLETAQKNG